ncbi:MAG: FliG C-terminal domain-containing protein [Parvularculaceae bacterium]|jgi:flagellar motor switch protein FliG
MTSEAAKLPAAAARLAIEHVGAGGLKPSAGGRAFFSGPQKAALIIAALGPEAAGPIIERIGDKHLKSFAEAYARLKNVPRKDLISVASEFLAQVTGDDDSGVKGGFEQARNLVSHFKGDENATKLFDTIDAPGGRSVWEKLETIDDEAIAGYLGKQNAQTVAVVLSKLDLDKASAVLAKLPNEIAQTVVTRLSKPSPVRREALDALASSIETEFLNPMRKAATAAKPGEMIGAMLNNMSEEKRAGLLAFIEQSSPDILADVKSAILTFADIPTRVPVKAVPQITREIDVPTLLKAVKYGRQNAPETVEFLFANISQRLVQQYEEQMKDMKPVPMAEAEAAQAEIMVAVRKLVAEGVFELTKLEVEGEADETVYV